MKTLKKAGKWISQAIIIGIITLFLFELSYRYQWIDFYAREWSWQNSEVDRGAKKRVLIFGDSFSADPGGWVGMLRDSLTDHAIYNASVSGVGPETFSLIFAQRMEEVSPQEVIVQLYVGNDLYDIEKPVSWSKLGFFRNLFWSVSNDFRVLNFLNYRLGQASPEDFVESDPKDADAFAAQSYSPRTRLYILGDDNYPASVINAGRRDERFNEMLGLLEEMKAACPKDTRFTVLVIPHCTQVASVYRDRYKELGAKISAKGVSKDAWIKGLDGFSVIDPLSVFEDAEVEGRAVYFANDPHLNKTGNELLTRIVREYLIQR